MRNTVSELANQMAVLCLLYKTRDNKKLLALRVNAVFIAIFLLYYEYGQAQQVVIIKRNGLHYSIITNSFVLTALELWLFGRTCSAFIM